MWALNACMGRTCGGPNELGLPAAHRSLYRPSPFPGQRFGLFLLRQFDKFKEEQACETENRFKEMSGLLHEQSTTIDGLRSSLARLSKQGPRGGTRR